MTNVMLAAILFLVILPKMAATKNNEITTISQFGYRFLDKRVLPDRKTNNLKACFDLCRETGGCRSINYNKNKGICELHSKSHVTHPQNLERRTGYIYTAMLDVKESQLPDTKYKTCAKLKQMKPSSPSGVYELDVNGSPKHVYCDMDNFGGGWSLVVSISASNKQHLIRNAYNCFNSSLCVPYTTGTLVGRKYSDADIRALASYEGTFRIDVTTSSSIWYYNFYRFAQGAQVLDSACRGVACPRIIVSYVYPYVWESNCFGTEKGYQIVKSTCYRVFDSHDNSECGASWSGSQYHGKRILYGHCTYNGIYLARQGNMYVR